MGDFESSCPLIPKFQLSTSLGDFVAKNDISSLCFSCASPAENSISINTLKHVFIIPDPPTSLTSLGELEKSETYGSNSNVYNFTFDNWYESNVD